MLFYEYSVQRSSYYTVFVDDESPASATVSCTAGGAPAIHNFNCSRLQISRQKWAGSCSASSEATALKIVQLIDVTAGTLDGIISIMLLFTPTDSSSASLTARVAQLLPDFLPHISTSACAIFRPLDTSGAGSLHAAVALQYVLTYCGNVIVRDMEDYLKLFAQFCHTPPSFCDLCKSIAIDLLMVPLIDASFHWPSCRASKLTDMRTSLWHKVFAHGTNSARSNGREHNPSRSLTSMIHVLSLTAAENYSVQEGKTLRVKSVNVNQFHVEPNSMTRVRLTSKPSCQDRETPRLSFCDTEKNVLINVEKQLPSATPKCSWPSVDSIRYCGYSMLRPDNNNMAEVIILFDSPFAACKLRAILEQAELLLFSSKGAFMARFCMFAKNDVFDV